MVAPPSGSRVYLDACALIYATELPEQYPGLRLHIFQPFVRGELTLITNWISLSEVLVKPLELRDNILENTYRRFMTPSPYLMILPANREIAEQAASLRALHRFKLPDAIHIATGMAAGCTHYVTGDDKWSRSGLQVIDAASL